MSKRKSKYRVFFRAFKSLVANVNLLYKGQTNGDRILQTAHRLEKGLCIATPKSLWGWDKANALAKALIKESNNIFAKETGLAVLNAYLANKEQSGVEDKKKVISFKTEFGDLLKEKVNKEFGGSITLHKEDMSYDVANVEKVFKMRHSIRDFDNTDVPLDKIIKAVELANHCPSACNRQPTHVYVISQDIWNNFANDMNQVYNAKQHLLVTASRRAFTLEEINDWIVSASIFAGYLSLSLTAVGLGSCVIKKGLLDDKAYEALKRHCGISSDEKIILEIAVGNYKDTFNVPVSNRKKIEQLLTVIDK